MVAFGANAGVPTLTMFLTGATATTGTITWPDDTDGYWPC
jgi:hypothetical protein